MALTVHHLDELLNESAATEQFKEAVRDLQGGKSGVAISYNRGVPPVKAMRAVMKLLETEPGMAINHVEINATSGCSDFVGTMNVNGGEARYDFVWDCSWRAKQENYTDHFGYPDQIRAAREFQYQCFQKFNRVD